MFMYIHIYIYITCICIFICMYICSCVCISGYAYIPRTHTRRMDIRIVKLLCQFGANRNVPCPCIWSSTVRHCMFVCAYMWERERVCVYIYIPCPCIWGSTVRHCMFVCAQRGCVRVYMCVCVCLGTFLAHASGTARCATRGLYAYTVLWTNTHELSVCMCVCACVRAYAYSNRRRRRVSNFLETTKNRKI